VFLKFKRNPCILNDAKLLHLEMGLYFQILVPIHKKTRACKKLLDVQGQHNRKLKKREMKMDLKSNVIDDVMKEIFILMTKCSFKFKTLLSCFQYGQSYVV
jgi:hypothetical protein